jgi:hypothetical protein
MYLRTPPFFGAGPVATGVDVVVVGAVVVAVVGAAVVVAVVVEAAGVVEETAGVVDEGVVADGVDEPQAVTREANTSKITRGNQSFFTFSSF